MKRPGEARAQGGRMRMRRAPNRGEPRSGALKGVAAFAVALHLAFLLAPSVAAAVEAIATDDTYSQAATAAIQGTKQTINVDSTSTGFVRFHLGAPTILDGLDP